VVTGDVGGGPDWIENAQIAFRDKTKCLLVVPGTHRGRSQRDSGGRGCALYDLSTTDTGHPYSPRVFSNATFILRGRSVFPDLWISGAQLQHENKRARGFERLRHSDEIVPYKYPWYRRLSYHRRNLDAGTHMDAERCFLVVAATNLLAMFGGVIWLELM
jgi:hypothetical protein